MSKPTKKELRAKIEAVLVRKDTVGMNAIGRALVHLKNRQTYDEQLSGSTRDHNGIGFQPTHAEIGTSMAEFYENRGYLTKKQIAYWQSDKNGLNKPRICRYWKQLVEEAELKMEREEHTTFNKHQMDCATDFNFDDDGQMTLKGIE